ncbi:NAD(P)-dependent dehydrogenase (short-subunit alcohol dehydrogenase family) [Rhodoligotrophos appendicifer]|uniref:SDR family NAD(P)-dependent oxidoreductase n=1 Tax=Rhodoligotrophos appendicifer TaxID=987056 RepID=UPI00118606BC|nr:glucose 1-dehydrogenase [Rhodoligotrophos appendicifer]
MSRLLGKVALVTGAGSIGPGWGNGKAMSTLFAREGAQVFAVDINAAAAEETRSIIDDECGTCATFAADVSKSDDVERAVNACLAAFGRIDILVNNVGVVRLGGVVELSEEDWDRANAINLKSVFLTCKHVIPHMLARKSGSVINISSIAAIRYTGIDYASYYATKGAMLSLTRGVALRYAGSGLRANCILPGLMDTPLVYADVARAYDSQEDQAVIKAKRDAMCPTGHMGDAWDVAYAALYLASDEAKYVTGTELVVDGGITAKFT